MWRDYFGQGAHIYGVDVNPACRQHAGAGIEILLATRVTQRFGSGFLRVCPLSML